MKSMKEIRIGKTPLLACERHLRMHGNGFKVREVEVSDSANCWWCLDDL